MAMLQRHQNSMRAAAPHHTAMGTASSRFQAQLPPATASPLPHTSSAAAFPSSPAVFAIIRQVNAKLASTHLDFEDLEKRLTGAPRAGVVDVAGPSLASGPAALAAVPTNTLARSKTSSSSPTLQQQQQHQYRLYPCATYRFTASVPMLVDALDVLMRLVGSVANIKRYADFHLTDPAAQHRSSAATATAAAGSMVHRNATPTTSNPYGAPPTSNPYGAPPTSNPYGAFLVPGLGMAAQSVAVAEHRTVQFTSSEAANLLADASALLRRIKVLEAEVLAALGADVTLIKKVNDNTSQALPGTGGGPLLQNVDRENYLASPIHSSKRLTDQDPAAVRKQVLGLMKRDPRYNKSAWPDNTSTSGDSGSASDVYGSSSNSSHPVRFVGTKRSAMEALLAKTLDEVAKEGLVQHFVLDEDEQIEEEGPAGGSVGDSAAAASCDAQGDEGASDLRREDDDPSVDMITQQLLAEAGIDLDGAAGDEQQRTAGPLDPLLPDGNDWGAAGEAPSAVAATRMPRILSAADLDATGMPENPLVLPDDGGQHCSSSSPEHDSHPSSPSSGGDDDLFRRPLRPSAVPSCMKPPLLPAGSLNWAPPLDPIRRGAAPSAASSSSPTPLAHRADSQRSSPTRSRMSPLPQQQAQPRLGSTSPVPPPKPAAAAAANLASLISLEEAKLPGATFTERLRDFVAKLAALPSFPWTVFLDTPGDPDSAYYFNHETSQQVASLEDFYADAYAQAEAEVLLGAKEWRRVAADHPSNTSGRPYFMNKVLSATTWDLPEWLKEH